MLSQIRVSPGPGACVVWCKKNLDKENKHETTIRGSSQMNSQSVNQVILDSEILFLIGFNEILFSEFLLLLFELISASGIARTMWQQVGQLNYEYRTKLTYFVCLKPATL